jgi:hypothetical protein
MRKSFLESVLKTSAIYDKIDKKQIKPIKSITEVLFCKNKFSLIGQVVDQGRKNA